MNSINKIIVEKIKSFKLFDLNSYNILVNNFGIDRVKEVFNELYNAADEVEKEKLNNVRLKVIPISIINCSGYMIPNIKKSEYRIIINARNYSKLSLEDKKFYTYITICHEVEHIKAFEKTKDENYYVFEHFMTLIEYIS